MKRSIATNSAYFALSNVLQFALTFLTGVLVGRMLGTGALGIYGLASAVGQIAFRFSELGIPTILTRMIASADPEATRRWSAAFVFRLWSSLVMVVAVELFAVAVGYDFEIQVVLALYCSSLVAAGLRDVASCAYYGREIMGRAALAMAAFRVIAFVLTLVSLLLGLGVAWAVAAMVVGQVVSLLIVVRGPIEVPTAFAPIDWTSVRAILRDSYPLAAAGILAMINSRVATLILSSYITEDQLGIYNAAFSVIIGFSLFPSSLLPAVFPVFARRYRSDVQAAMRLYLHMQVFSLVVGLACATIAYFLADFAMSVLYGPEFAAAAPLVRVVCWSVPFTFVAYTHLNFFNATNRQHNNLVVTAIAAVTNVTANLLLIPHHAALGAAWATVLSEAALFATTCVLAGVFRHDMRRTAP